MLNQHTIDFRVEYHETDGQRRVHHANYLNYFERGRVELLRAAGFSYKSLEDAGQRLVVTEMQIQYHAAADFDDLLTLTTRVVSARGVRIRHAYHIRCGETGVVSGQSTIACIGVDGRPQRLPDYLRSTPGDGLDLS